MSMFANAFAEILRRNIAVSLVILLVLAVRLLLRRYPKRYSYVLWSMAGFRMLFDIRIPSPVRLLPSLGISRLEQAITAPIRQFPAGEGGQNFAAFTQPAGQTGAAQTAVGELAEKLSAWELCFAVLFFLWLGGILVFFFVEELSVFRLEKKVRQAVLLRERIYECDDIASPFVFGIFRPRVYIPFGLTEQERAYVLAHEQYHIRRLDPLTRLLAFILLAGYWMNPLAWAAYFCFIRDQEMSCDEAVLRRYGMEAKQDYSRLLLGFAEKNSGYLFTPVAFGESDAGRRIRNVLHYRKIKTGLALLLAGIVVLAILIGLAGGKDAAEEQGRKDGQNSLTAENSDAADMQANTAGEETQTDGADGEGADGAEADSTGAGGEDAAEEQGKKNEQSSAELLTAASEDAILSLEELKTLCAASDWKEFVGRGNIGIWRGFENLVWDEEFAEHSVTNCLTADYEYAGVQYQLSVCYEPDGNTGGTVTDLYFCNRDNNDMILLYSADDRYKADADLNGFLSKVYDVSASITMEQLIIPDSKEPSLPVIGPYQMNLFYGFSGSLFEWTGYEEPIHGEWCPQSWYAMGGIGEWCGEKGELFLYDGDTLSWANILGNHMDCELVETFSSDTFSGLLYEYEFDLYTLPEVEEAGLSYEDERLLSHYWVAYLSAGQEEPVYVLFLNKQIFDQESVLRYADSIRPSG